MRSARQSGEARAPRSPAEYWVRCDKRLPGTAQENGIPQPGSDREWLGKALRGTGLAERPDSLHIAQSHNASQQRSADPAADPAEIREIVAPAAFSTGTVLAHVVRAMSPGRASVASTLPLPPRVASDLPALLPVLVVLNLCLQVVDGLATCAGVSRGVLEGNVLLRLLFPYLGVPATVALFKASASVLILAVAVAGPRRLATVGLSLTAVVYFTAAFLPWAVLLLATP